jgi:hypothetical protein
LPPFTKGTENVIGGTYTLSIMPNAALKISENYIKNGIIKSTNLGIEYHYGRKSRASSYHVKSGVIKGDLIGRA